MTSTIPPRMYLGPRQEKQYRKNQRQLQQKELQIVAKRRDEATPLVDSFDSQETEEEASLSKSKALVPISISNSIPEPKLEVPNVSVSRPNLPLIVLAFILFLITLAVNVSVAWGKGTTVLDKAIMSSLGAVFEAMLFFLPSQASSLWMQHRWLSSILASILCVLLFVSALMASLAFASLNLTDTATARSERVTPAVSDAQRRLDTLSASRATECLKRGDRCRQLEKDEQQALESLREAREKVSATSDPQVVFASKLVSWVSLGRYNPTADDFAMLRLLLLTLLPQLGGLVLMLASRS